MKIIGDINDIDLKILANEFIVTVDIQSKDEVSMKLLKFLRDGEIKIEDAAIFHEICMIIEDKLFG
ncbi:hypothetical protein [Clostridium formicaceticum]|uniref:Uncharacterized protein n=1 Tax=Clostridium formicaceticum TaxID=1497 RepID=A0AAC9RHN9_9CLOT|nr:hypothetical protein [Clostridium formicaceticum]AOY76733.1 hypothetical protein BJL90_13160 [Clostridium formicaceticum]ARE87169.1 hypothetical protein CLFO_15570 [Clostridium formicaceticum]